MEGLSLSLFTADVKGEAGADGSGRGELCGEVNGAGGTGDGRACSGGRVGAPPSKSGQNDLLPEVWSALRQECAVSQHWAA